MQNLRDKRESELGNMAIFKGGLILWGIVLYGYASDLYSVVIAW